MLARAAARRQIRPEIKALGKRNRALPQGERIEIAILSGSLGDYQAPPRPPRSKSRTPFTGRTRAELRCNRAVASTVCCNVDVALKLIPTRKRLAREFDERQRFLLCACFCPPGTSRSLRGNPLFDPNRRQAKAVLSNSTKAAAATGNTRPRRVARTSLAWSRGGSISGSAIMSPGGMGALPGLRN